MTARRYVIVKDGFIVNTILADDVTDVTFDDGSVLMLETDANASGVPVHPADVTPAPVPPNIPIGHIQGTATVTDPAPT